MKLHAIIAHLAITFVTFTLASPLQPRAEVVLDATKCQAANNANIVCLDHTNKSGLLAPDPNWSECQVLVDKIRTKVGADLDAFKIARFDDTEKTRTGWAYENCIMEFDVSGDIARPETIVADLGEILVWAEDFVKNGTDWAVSNCLDVRNGARCFVEDPLGVTFDVFYWPDGDRLERIEYLD